MNTSAPTPGESIAGGGRALGAPTRVRADELALGRHHFHWLRSLLEGLPPAGSWDRYIAFEGSAFDARLHPTRLGKLLARIERAAGSRGLKRALTEVALHRKRFWETASRLSTGPEDSSTELSPRPPSISDWVEAEVRRHRQADPSFDRDFWSEREWLELYESEWGSAAADCDDQPPLPSPSLRYIASQLHEEISPDLDDVGLREQLAALNELERALTRNPLPGDPTTAWLRGNVTTGLSAANVSTMDELVSFINRHGRRWHARVPGVGPALAGHIIDWLKPWATAWDIPLQASSLLPRPLSALQRLDSLRYIEAPRRFALVPLDRLDVPPFLDGRTGRFRREGANTWGAHTDLEAITNWLKRYAERAKTFQTYGRIVERMYLWCLLERNIALSDVTEADVLAHRDFLTSPPPHWVGKHGVERASDDWRPLRGPLDQVSQRHTFVVIASMFSGFVEAGYMSVNPAAGVVPRMRLPSPRINIKRRFTEDQWSMVLESLAAAKDTPFVRRTRLVLELGVTTGLRHSELSLARIRDLRVESIDGEPQLILSVRGKGDKERDVPLPGHLKALIDAHHRDMVAAGTDFSPEQLSIRSKHNDHPTESGRSESLRPLIGALRMPPPTWEMGDDGKPRLQESKQTLADRYGALDGGALYQSLKRTFKAALAHAETSGRLLSESDRHAFQAASTHWLRHFFATTYVGTYGMDLSGAMTMLGHASLATTSVYTSPELKTVVRALRIAERKRHI